MRVAAFLLAVAAGCRLDPLVDDVPGASANLLPSGSAVPIATDNADLTNQIVQHDGLDDDALDAAGGLIARGDGLSAGLPVHYWSFGATTQAPSPLYVFYRHGDAGLEPIAHPAMVDAVPGDGGYSPMHTLVQVVVTDKYAGQIIVDPAALGDAIGLGLVEEPAPTGTSVPSPIVLPGTRLEVGGPAPATAEVVYARGYEVGMFRFGGARGVQPAGAFQPTSQVSYLREAHAVSYDPQRPIFQAQIPTAPPGMLANYTPVSVVVDVDLAPGTHATEITQDSDLFIRSPQGEITASTDQVAVFQVTTTILLLPMQFTDGEP